MPLPVQPLDSRANTAGNRHLFILFIYAVAGAAPCVGRSEY